MHLVKNFITTFFFSSEMALQSSYGWSKCLFFAICYAGYMNYLILGKKGSRKSTEITICWGSSCSNTGTFATWKASIEGILHPVALWMWMVCYCGLVVFSRESLNRLFKNWKPQLERISQNRRWLTWRNALGVISMKCTSIDNEGLLLYKGRNEPDQQVAILNLVIPE